MSKFTLLMALVAMASWVERGDAQTPQTRTLSVEEMFELADENNRSIKADASAVAAAAGIGIAKGAYLPSLDVSLSLAYNGNGAFADRDFTHWQTAQIPHFGNNFALEASQVIYAGGALRNGVRMAELQAQMAVLAAESNRQGIRFLIAGNYLELCKALNQLQVFDSNIALSRQALDNMRSRNREGTALPNDITRYELQLQNLSYTKIQLENSMQIINNQLVAALGLPAETRIVPKHTNDTDFTDLHSSILGSDSNFVDLSNKNRCQSIKSVSSVCSNSPTLKTAELAVQISEQAERLVHTEKRPTIALFAGEYLDGPIVIEIPALNNNFNYWAVGVGIKYDIGSLYRTNRKINAARLAVRKANDDKAIAEEQLSLSIEAAAIRYREAFALRDTKLKSVELAQQNYDVVNRRYENDLALITDLLDAASQKLDAELQVVNAQINILYNFYKLKYIAGRL